MKNTPFLLCLVFAAALSIAHAASIPVMEVTVTNAAGKVAYRGTTNANGAFTTGQLEPGNYVVAFTAKGKIAKNARFALLASADKNNVSSDSVPGEKFLDPGIAMKLSVAGSSKITGQVSLAGSAPAPVASSNTKTKATGPVKIINGKRYIWVVPNTGSVSGGQWVEESEAAAQSGTKVMQTPVPKQNSMSTRY